MVRPGSECPGEDNPELVAAATVKVFGSCFPAILPGIVFLSGGMSEEFATASLAAINANPGRKALPWPLTFSFGRALQHSARVTWLGKDENYGAAQEALLARIDDLSEDTYTQTDRFYSFRRATHLGEDTGGRQISMVALPR